MLVSYTVDVKEKEGKKMNTKKEVETKNRTKNQEKLTVIFDMDGTIVDSAIFHYEAWQVILQKRGVSYPYDRFKRNFGRRSDLTVRELLGSSLSDAEVAAICEEKDAAFRGIARNKITALPGVISLIRSLKERRVKTAIGSSSPLENIKMVVASLGLEKDFDAIVYGTEVKESKPSPQIFLLAAKKMGVEPRYCVVIEDALHGITAAKRGGMRALAVTNTQPKEQFTEADLVTDSLEKISFDDLRNLVFTGEKAGSASIINTEIIPVPGLKEREAIAI
jgi:beta-phosphoglucomutase